MLSKVIILCLLVGYIQSKKLPSYISQCSKSDPELQKCALEKAIAVLPRLMKGDKEYKYPMLDPFTLDSIELHPGNSLSIKLKDVTLTGISGVKILDLKFDLEKHTIFIKLNAPSINLLCQYSIDGKILVLPISGSGPGNMTFENIVVNFMTDFNLIKKKDGKEYIDTNNLKPTVTFTISKSRFHLDNLFNGDKALGDHMNKFLNENDQDVAKDLGSSVSETINAIATQIIRNIFSMVPYDEIFLP